MKYDFDTIIERRNTNSYKWDRTEQRVGIKDVLPLWVADMDFQSPLPIIEALKKRIEHGIFGYTFIPDSCYEAIIVWMKKRYGWEINKEWIVFTPGVVPSFYWVVNTYTHSGDSVLVQPPVYYPFFSAVTYNGCQLVENSLQYKDGHYQIDFEDLGKKLRSPRTKVLILCSPHNPVGRVWAQEELSRLGELCLKHQVMICSDEIHADLIFPGSKHIPVAMLSDEIAQNTVTCMAANKTFNIAGLTTGFMIIPNRQLRIEFSHTVQNTGIGLLNLLGPLATEVAYTQGEEWLEQLLVYLQDNLEFLTRFVEERIPKIKVIKPEGCYLAWLDCRELNLNDAELKNFMLKKARVWLNDGPTFGKGGSGFQRLNFGCPRSILEKALLRIEHAVKEELL